jgi:hypothetical protein
VEPEQPECREMTGSFFGGCDRRPLYMLQRCRGGGTRESTKLASAWAAHTEDGPLDGGAHGAMRFRSARAPALRGGPIPSLGEGRLLQCASSPTSALTRRSATPFVSCAAHPGAPRDFPARDPDLPGGPMRLSRAFGLFPQQSHRGASSCAAPIS